MKTLSCIALVCALGLSSAFAQGTLIFSSSTAVVRDRRGVLVPAGSGQVQFAWAPLGTAYTPWNSFMTAAQWWASNPGWTVIGAPAELGIPIPGRFSGGTLTANTTPPGAIIQGVVIGWLGTTSAPDFLSGYQAAVSVGWGDFGDSSPFTVDTGDPTTVPPGTAGGIANSTTTPFTGDVFWIPEPSGFALATLGFAVALAMRRRK